MELFSDSVTYKLTDNRKTSVLTMLCNRSSDIADSAACNSLLNADIKAFSGRVTQPLRFGAYCSCSESSSIVAVVTVEPCAKVYADDVAFFDYSRFAWYSMNNLIVYGNACRSRIAIIVRKFGSAPHFLI